MTNDSSFGRGILDRIAMACFVAALVAAGVAIVRAGSPASVMVQGARSVATIESMVPDGDQVGDGLAAEVAAPVDPAAAVPAQDDDAEEDSAGEDAADESGDDDAEPEPEKATIKVKYPSAESDFDVELITRLAVDKGDEVASGDLLLEVSNRPMFVFEGSSPAVRSLTVGTVGPDVAQLERALAALGYSVGAVDETFDAATAAGVAAFYQDHGYDLPPGNEKDTEDLESAQTKLAEAQAKRDAALVALTAATTPDPVSGQEDLFEINKVQSEIELSEAKLAEFRRRDRDLTDVLADFALLRASIASGIANGMFDANDPESITSDLASLLDDLTNDDPDDFNTFDEMFAEIDEERDKIFEARAAATIDVLDEESELEILNDELDLAWNAYYEIPNNDDEDKARADIAEVDAEIAGLHLEIGRLSTRTGARMSIDEFVFAPGLPGEIDDIEVDVRDEADGTLLKIKTG